MRFFWEFVFNIPATLADWAKDRLASLGSSLWKSVYGPPRTW
jgi:hypothetical protein